MSKNKTDSGHNRLFRRNGNKILYAFLKLLHLHHGYITAWKVAKVSGLSRQTIYNHHPHIDQALIQGEGELLDEFTTELDINDKKFSKMIRDPNRRVFYAMLIFMNQHKDIFCLVCADINNQGLLY